MIEHVAFRATLAALAHPGRPQSLAATGVRDGIGAMRVVVAALYEEPQALQPHDRAPIRTIPHGAALADAAVVLVAGEPSVEVLRSVARGTDEFPEAGATIVASLAAGSSLTPVRLRGPGIDGAYRTSLPLSRASLAARDEACAAYPLGIDLLLVDDDACVVGLPRTTRVEICD